MKDKKIEHIKELLRKKAPEFATRVTPIYAILNWQWAFDGVPTRWQILKSLLKKIDKLGGKSGIISTSSGGLKAAIEEDNTIKGGYLIGVISMDINEVVYQEEK